MQLNPRYGSDPILELDGDLSLIAEATTRQNRRLGAMLSTLTEEQWSHPTRCSEWDVRDVIVHLGITNQFWTMSVTAGLAGDPTRFLANFDPVASPLEMGANNVDSPSTVLAKFLEASDAWCALLADISPEGWHQTGEAPPGHISIGAVVHHALWDSWVHERDILLPLGEAPTEDPDEVLMSLRYGVALGSTLAISQGTGQTGSVTFDVAQPDAVFSLSVGEVAVVETGAVDGAPVIAADAVPLLEGISMRAPMPMTPSEDIAWVFGGLKAAFDQ